MEGIRNGYVYFFAGKPSHHWHKGMKLCFSEAKKLGLRVEWVNQKQLKDMTLPSNELVLVVAEFVSEYLQVADEAFRIVGPYCLLECLEKKISIPDNNSPIYFLGMNNVVISCTKVSKAKKADIAKLVGYMGGLYTEAFSNQVTHLIADRAGPSDKLDVALQRNIPVLLPSWIYAAWERGPEGGDAVNLMDEHKLKPFSGLQITISGLNSSLKRRYAQLIEAHGGKYDPNLVQNVTDIVITTEGAVGSQKVKSAISWKIPCISSSWLEDSVAAGHPLRISQYAIRAKPTCSTPTKGDLPSFIGSEEISVVQGGSELGVGYVNDTVSSVGSVGSWKPSLSTPSKNFPAPSNAVEHRSAAKSASTNPTPSRAGSSASDEQDSNNVQWLEELSPTSVRTAGQFLDGCRIYLEGWKERDRLSRVMVRAGATVLEALSDRVSHAVVADSSTATAVKSKCSVSCVNLGWVVASMKEGRPVKVDNFLFSVGPCNTGMGKPVPPSPLSSKGLELLRSKKPSSSNVSTTSEEAPLPMQSPAVAGPAVSRKLFNTPKKSRDTGGGTEATTVGGESSLSSETFATSTLFQGLVFAVVGFDDDTSATNCEVLESCGGSVMPTVPSGRIVDYAVVPIEGTSDRISAAEVVTPLWIDDCRDCGKVVDVAYYHRPVAIGNFDRLKECAICLTGFQGRERLFLATLASTLGAVVQDAFSRRDVPKKGVVRSTHLVAYEAFGPKYEAAINWGIPAVRAAWVLEAAQPGEGPPPENRYAFDSAAAAEATVLAPTETPKAKGDHTQSGYEIQVTPAVKASSSKVAANNISSHQPTVDCMPSVREDQPTAGDLQVPADQSLSKRPSENDPPDDITPLKRRREEAAEPMLSPLQALIRNKKSLSLTPKNRNSLDSSRGSATPDTPYGAAFHDNPSPATRKYWKKYIQNFPCLPPEPPLPARRQSTPLSVIKMQLQAKIGIDVEGIEKDTGKILKGGPYTEWAKNTPETSNSSSIQRMEVGREDENTTPKNPKQPQEPFKSGSKAVNELLDLMSEIKRNSDIGDIPNGETAEDIDELALRLRRQPAAAAAGHEDHPLNKLRPNIESDFQAERPAGDYGDSEDVASGPTQGSASQSCTPQSARDGNTQALHQEDENTDKTSGVNKTFILSNLPVGAKEKYEGIIAGLGGNAGLSGIYEDGTTHLVIERPLRNEKLLCAIAAGNWVLHHSYLDMCYEARRFLDEEDYEFGNSRSECRIPRLEPGTQADLAAAACRWRKRVATLGKKAFSQLVVAMFVREGSSPMFTRLLNAGAATIVSNPLEANLVLVEEEKVPLPEQLPELARRRIPVVPPVYLSVYIVKYPRVDPFDHLISAYPKT